MLLYSLDAASRLCSVTDRSSTVEPSGRVASWCCARPWAKDCTCRAGRTHAPAERRCCAEVRRKLQRGAPTVGAAAAAAQPACGTMSYLCRLQDALQVDLLQKGVERQLGAALVLRLGRGGARLSVKAGPPMRCCAALSQLPSWKQLLTPVPCTVKGWIEHSLANARGERCGGGTHTYTASTQMCVHSKQTSSISGAATG